MTVLELWHICNYFTLKWKYLMTDLTYFYETVLLLVYPFFPQNFALMYISVLYVNMGPDNLCFP